MWIRSQDKKRLIKCNDIEVSGKSIVIDDRYGVVDIGRYSTEAKAFKVFEDMMSWINGLEYDRTTKRCRANYVYQMPQDEEV